MGVKIDLDNFEYNSKYELPDEHRWDFMEDSENEIPQDNFSASDDFSDLSDSESSLDFSSQNDDNNSEDFSTEQSFDL